MSRKKCITTEKAPAAIGPYSQAVVSDGTVFVSGQLGLDPESGKLVGPETASQARQVLKNIEAVLAEAGLGMDDIVKITIYLRDIGDFHTVNTLFTETFSEPYPARACIQAAALPKAAEVEMEAIATVSG